MPSPHSSAETQADARAIAANIGAELIEIPIEATMGSYEGALAEAFAGAPGATRAPSPATRPGPPSPTSPPRTSRPGSAATS